MPHILTTRPTDLLQRESGFPPRRTDYILITRMTTWQRPNTPFLSQRSLTILWKLEVHIAHKGFSLLDLQATEALFYLQGPEWHVVKTTYTIWDPLLPKYTTKTSNISYLLSPPKRRPPHTDRLLKAIVEHGPTLNFHWQWMVSRKMATWSSQNGTEPHPAYTNSHPQFQIPAGDTIEKKDLWSTYGGSVLGFNHSGRRYTP